MHSNHSTLSPIATIGQLKAVFSLRFETLAVTSLDDLDQDGLPDPWELAHGLNPNDSAAAGYPSGYDNAGNLLKIVESYGRADIKARTVTNTYPKFLTMKL